MIQSNNSVCRRRGEAATEEKTEHGKVRLLLILSAALLTLCAAAFAFGLWARGRTPDSEKEVFRCGDVTLTNRDLAYYYWSEYYVLVNEGGTALDPDTDPALQPVDDTRTWADTLTDRALLTAQDTLAHVCAAQAEGFALPAEYRASMEQVMADLDDYAVGLGFTNEDGSADLDAYLRASYGADAEQTSFRRYMEHAYLATAYADRLRETLPAPDDAEVRAYFAVHRQDFPELSEDDGPMPDAIILTFDRYDDDLAVAATVLSAFQAASGDAEALLALGEEYCGGAKEEQGLYRGDGVTPECAADWLFDPERQAGQSTVVSDEEGAYLLYVTGFEAEVRWQTAAADAMCEEELRNRSLQLAQDYPAEVDRKNIVIPQPDGLFVQEDQG